jgi:cation-transporting ATPase 13A1
VPGYYDTCYKGYAAEGARVIALAAKRLPGDLGPVELRALGREEVEAGLEFVGFAVFQVGGGAGVCGVCGVPGGGRGAVF